MMEHHFTPGDSRVDLAWRASETYVEAQDGPSSPRRLDGSGYPDGLKGDNIPLLAQIMAIVDDESGCI